MTKYLLLSLMLLLLACTKNGTDTKYTFVCTSTYQQNPFSIYTKDTTFYNITANDANSYARNHTVNGWVTTCERQ